MQFLEEKKKILIIDFGSQVTKLIARRIRDLGVFSEVITPIEIKNIKSFNLIKGIILSGGPSSVTKRAFQSIPKSIFLKKIGCEFCFLYKYRLQQAQRRTILFVKSLVNNISCKSSVL